MVTAISRTLCLVVACALFAGAAAGNARSDTPRASGLGAAALAADAARLSHHRFDRETHGNLRCLALNIYWEARSEPVMGQLAVAAVTLNRVRDARFPDTVCRVVKQGGWKRRHRCQFSWWCDGKKDDPEDEEAWRRAEFVARLAYAGAAQDPSNGALWYHAEYVKPAWRMDKQPTGKIGRHLFYTHPEGTDETELGDETADVTRVAFRLVARSLQRLY